MNHDCGARRTALVLLSLSIVFAAGTAVANGECKLAQLAELPVTMTNSAPIVSAKINGVEASFIADSGSFFSLLSGPAAARYQLRTSPGAAGFYLGGVNGSVRPEVATVKEFTLADLTIKDLEFLVGGGDVGGGSVGLLGQNVFHIADVEYDLGHGVIRLMRPADCKHTSLAYWTSGAPPSYSMMDVNRYSREEPFTVGSASLNGKAIRVMFDSGANRSFLTRRAAERVGIDVEGPDATPGGEAYGIGRGMIKTWIVPVASFKVGDEEIRNTRLRVGELTSSNVDMLIGADFFLSHRLYVASGRGKLYFTYNGGPVFDLSVRSKPADAAAGTVGSAADEESTGAGTPTGAAPATEATATAAAPAASAAAPTTAAEFSRRGTAFASRQDFASAIADLTRACELAPDNADYFYQRGQVHWQNRQPEAALADLDHALELKPDLVPALVARASVRAARRQAKAAAVDSGGEGPGGRDALAVDWAGVVADLDAADRAAAKEADVRLYMGQLYSQANISQANALPQAIRQFNLWVDAHADDARLPFALRERCWARGLSGTELKPALDDCNTAIRRLDKGGDTGAGALDARGLVRLRLGDFDKAIADFDAALKLQPKNAWARYARGIAEIRRGKGGGSEDLASATADSPKLAEYFTAHGLTP